MSSIAFQPNASGTGIFTIASPDGNTNRTITLPDADVTLGEPFDLAALAEAIDAATPMGIGWITRVAVPGRNTNTPSFDVYQPGDLLSGSNAFTYSATPSFSFDSTSGSEGQTGSITLWYVAALTGTWMALSRIQNNNSGATSSRRSGFGLAVRIA